MKFINNTAVEADDALYGGLIDLCFALTPSKFLNHNGTLKGTLTFDSVSDLSEQPPYTLQVYHRIQRRYAFVLMIFMTAQSRT